MILTHLSITTNSFKMCITHSRSFPLKRLDDVKEKFNGPCQYLSSDPPVQSHNDFKSMDISSSVYFNVSIPKDMFEAPDSGRTMPVTVELRLEDGTVLDATSWIQTTDKPIKEGIDIQGCLPYLDAKTSQSYSFKLIAKTPILEVASSVFTVSVKSFQDIVKNYIVTFTAHVSSTITINYSRFIQSFITVLATYIGVKDSSIIIYSYGLVDGAPTLRWTLQELVSAAPSIQTVSEISSKLYRVNKVPNTVLVQELMKINFNLSTITVQVGGSFQKPQMLKPIRAFMKWKTMFSYTIPNDSYADATDGTHLSLQILTGEGESSFSNKNWLTIAKGSRVIRGIPVTSTFPQETLQKYNIRLTNSLGNYVDDIFYLSTEGASPTYSYMYKFDLMYTTVSEVKSLYDILSLFTQKLYFYFSDSNQDALIITNTITIPSSKTISIFYFNSSFRVNPCDTPAIVAANMKIFQGRDPNQDLVDVMKPEFIVNEITTTEYDSCRPEKNLPPIIRPELLSHAGPHQIRWGETFLSKLPEGLFHDEEDGPTSKLTITFHALGSNINLPLTSWIYYNKNKMIVYAVPARKSFAKASSQKGEIKYVLRARDSGGKTIATEYIVVLSGQATTLYNVTFSINLYGISKLSYAEQLHTIVSELEILFGNPFKNKICVQHYEVTSITGNDGSAVLIWTHCSIPLRTCNFGLINDIRDHIYNPGSSQINAELNQRFNAFMVVGVGDLGTGACGLNAPEITGQIKPHEITFCGLHLLQIPSNAFTDKEEGSTQNLKLSLSKADDAPLEDWMEFDSKTQTLSMLLVSSMDNFLLQRQQKFKLTATDSSRLSRSQSISINIRGNSDTVDFKKILILNKTSEFVATGKKTFIEVARKVGSFFNDEGRSFEAIRASRTSDGFDFYEFGNCAIRSSPCDAVVMQEYRQKVMNPSFSKIFEPELIIQSSSNSFSGPCSTDGSPVVLNQWQPIQVEITKTYVLQVPANSFQDKEQGFTKELDLELKGFLSQDLPKTSWVQFDAISQKITIVATKNAALALQNQPAKALKLKLYAYDIKRQYAVMDITIKVILPETEYSHFITMQLTVISKPLETSTYTNIYTTLREDIMAYFNDDQGQSSVAYTTATSDFTTTMEVRWSNATISSSVCENAKLKYMMERIFSSGVTVSPELIRALAANFNVVNVAFSYHGICADERKPPTVMNPIPPLQTSYCGSIFVTIPANTFNDQIDGDTRNLKLSMAYQNGTEVTKNSEGAGLIAFDETKQHLSVTPVFEEFRRITQPIILVLKATTIRGLSVVTNVEVTIQNPPPKYSFSVKVTGERSPVLSFSDSLQVLQRETSKYLFSSTGRIFFVEAASHSTSLTVTFGFCSFEYEPCDKTNIGIITNKLKGRTQSINPDYANALKPDIHLSTMITIPSGPCSVGDNPPAVTKLIPDVTLQMCSAVRYKLNPDTFTDIEDGNNLSFVLTSLNNVPINEASTWIYATFGNEVLATVSNKVFETSQTYKVNVRAYDKKQQYADTIWNIQISGSPRKFFHTFKLTVTAKKSGNQPFVDRYKLATLLNTFFGGNVTNVQSFDQTNDGRLLFEFSSCSLPDYCDPNGAGDILSRIQAKNFKDHISPDYTLIQAELHSIEACNGPLNPPSPSSIAWDIEVNVCGGSVAKVPSNMFIDTEDGGTRNLVLTFSSFQYNMSLPKWMRFDSTNQTLYILPTLQEASSFEQTNSQVVYWLTAIDKSGLSTSIVTRLKMKLPVQDSKYKFRFQFRLTETNINAEIEIRRLFIDGVAKYMRSSIDTILINSFASVSETNQGTKEIIFSNCSITYSPSCDLASLKTLKNVMMDQNNFPRSSFQQVMTSYSISILIGLISIQPPCTETYNPPTIQNHIPVITISICADGIQTFVIPANTFYDPQDGRNLKYTMSTVQGGSLTNQSWIQFDSESRKISMFPLVFTGGSNLLTNKHLYSVTVTDTSNLQVSAAANIETTGALDIFKECQIQIDFKSTPSSQNNLIHRLNYLNSQLKTFFQLQSNENIAFVRYSATDQTKFTISFSYCSPLYTSSILKVDYHNLSNKILKRMFQSDRRSVTASFKSAFSNIYIVENARTLFTGRCQNLPPVTSDSSPAITFTVPTCGYTQQTISENQFYDFEDGSTSSLKLELYYATNEGALELNSAEHWINVDSKSKSIIAILDDQVRSGSSTGKVFKFLLRATDKSEAYIDVPITIFISSNPPIQMAPFEITFEMRYSGGDRSRPMVYEGMYLMQRIKIFYSLTQQNPSIALKRYTVSPGFPNYRTLTWTLCTGAQCNANGVLDKTKQLYTKQSKQLNSSFIKAFEPQFNMERVYYMSSKCTPETDPPFVQSSITKLKPSYCSFFTYKLPNDLFYDKENGEMENLRISLHDSNGDPVKTSSMIQLNRARLQLFAINVQSTLPRLLTYQISATNSKKLTRTTSFQVEYLSTPFVTDCPITMLFRYTHLTSTTTDLDVMIQMMNLITRYYGDQQVMIKMLDFKRSSTTTNNFQMQWTNCSLQHATSQEALHGLADSQREALASIFSKVFDTETNKINRQFVSAVSPDFLIDRVTVSFTCIESPPTPNSNAVQREFATYCQQFRQSLPVDLFTDTRDGDIRSMKLTLTYRDGETVSKREWIQLSTDDKENQYLYGFVTPRVDQESINRTYLYEIVCTDSSGRKAAKKIQIQIYGSVPDLVTNTISLGITSQLPAEKSDAYVLTKLAEKLAKYQDPLDTKSRLFVSYFQRNSVIRFSYCQIACSQNNMNDLYGKFQTIKYQTKPSTELKDQLHEDFETNYVFIDSSKCLPASNINVIPTNQCSPIPIPICGSFSSIIPRTCFGDTSGSDTRSFLLEMKTRTGDPLPNTSWLQFDIPRQMVYGTVVTNQMDKSTHTYTLSATHPSSGRSVSTNFQVNVDGYGDYENVKNEVCQVTLEFSSNDKRSSQRNDVDIVHDLVSVITSYINSNIKSLIVIKFTRVGETISLTYANCTWYEILEQGVPTDVYLQNINQILEQYFLITQTTVIGITSSFKNYLTSKGYQYRGVLTTYSCTKPPNPPPSRIKDLDLSIKTSCGIFEFPIPEDTFVDRKYGNTRQLFLELFQEDGITKPDWVGINSKQDLYGMINKQISESQPSTGYRFILKATNPVGQSSTTSVVVKLEPKKWIGEFSKIIIATIPSQIKENRLPYKIALVKNIQQYQPFVNVFQGSFYVQEMVSGSFGDLIRLSYCEQCNGLNYLKARALQSPVNQNKLIQHLSPGFNVQGSLFVELPSTDQLKTECIGIPANLATPLTKEIKFCSSKNVWNLVDDFTTLIEDFKVSLTYADGSPLPSESWINLVFKPYRVVSFPTESVWSRQPSNGYRFQVVLRDQTDSAIIGTPALFDFKIVGNPKADGLTYTMSLVSTSPRSAALSDAAFIYDFWRRINQYFGYSADSETSLQHIRLKRNNLKADITWLNCSLPTSCRGADVDKVNNLLKTGSTKINNALISAFAPGYQIKNVTLLCSDNPPVVQPKLNLTVPQCGCFSFKLPNGFATDEHDQNKLTVELFGSDGVTRLPRSSWIVYKASTKTIEALPDDSTISLYDKTKGFVYILRVTDTKGKYSTSKVTVYLDLKITQSFLSYSFSFKSLYPITLSFVELKKTFLENFVQESKSPGETVDRFRVTSLSTVNEQAQQFVIRLMNCSVVQYTCPDEYQKIVEFSGNLVGNDMNRLKQQMSLRTAGNIVISNIVKSLDIQVNRPPLIANPMRVINVTYCDNGAFKIPSDTFRNEIGDAIKYKLYEKNRKPISQVNWINVVDDVLYVSPLTSVSSGLHTFRLEAFDQCNLKTETDLKVVLTGDNSPSPYYLVMQFKYKSIQKNYANSIWNVRAATKRCSDAINHFSSSTTPTMIIRDIKTERFTSDDSGYMRFQYSHCSVKRNTCVQTDLDKLSANIFSSPNIVADSFKQCFRPECELLQATEFRVDMCKPVSPPPKVVLQPVFNATFCTKSIFKIDPKTFTDESGTKDARSMNLELLTETFDPLPVTEWLQFDAFRQEIYGYPRTGETQSVKTTYRYKLRATEIQTGASSSTDVVIYMLGKPNVNFVMELKGKRAVTQKPNIEEEIQIIDSLKQAMEEGRLNDISFNRQGENLSFKWGFCTIKTNQCDCQKIRRFEKSKNQLKMQLGTLMIVDSISAQKSGQCSEGPIHLNPIPKLKLIPVGQCFSIEFPNNLYYDRQDGNNVRYFIQSEDGTFVAKDHWLQMDQSGSRLCGILPYQTYLTSTMASNKYSFKLGAEDSCLNRVVNKTEVDIDPKKYLFIDFVLIGVLKEDKGNFMRNCTRIELLVNKISSYSKVNKTDIHVKEIRAINSTRGENLTEITWGHRIVNCSNQTYTRLYEEYFTDNNNKNQKQTVSMKPEFADYMGPEFELETLRHGRASDCADLVPLAARTGDENFPWWWLWMLLAIALLALLLWFVWICCPRACPNCCGNRLWASLCGKCCAPLGNYSSFKDNQRDLAKKTAEEPVENAKEGMFLSLNSIDSLVSPLSVNVEHIL